MADNDISTYAGVPSNGAQYGILIRTGLAGPSTPEQYGGTPVFDASGRPVAPGTTIPPGAQVSLGWPASGATGGQVLTGTQIPLDAEYIRQSQFGDQLAQQTFNEQLRQFDLTYAQSTMNAERQYQLDVMMFGEQQAARRLNESIAAATQEYNQQRLALDTELGRGNLELGKGQLGVSAQNAQTQRELGEKNAALMERQQDFAEQQALASGKLDITNMLAQKSGPQDYVSYANTLNRLSPPTPRASQSLDVFTILKGMEDHIAAQNPASPFTQPPPPLVAAQPAGPPTSVTPAPVPAPAPVPPPQPKMNDLLSQIQGFERGGIMGGGGMAITGDSSTGRPNEELVVNLNPDPEDRIAVVPLSNLRSGLGSGQPKPLRGNAQRSGRPPEPWTGGLGTVPLGQQRTPSPWLGGLGSGQPKPLRGNAQRSGMNVAAMLRGRQAPAGGMDIAAMLRGIPRAETGGVYDAGLSGNTETYNTYSPETHRNLPFLQKLRGDMDSTVGGFGASPVNAQLGIGPGDFPDTFNMRDFMRLFPSEQQMTKSLAEQGLGLNLEDLLFRSMRLGPQGSALPVSTFGR